MRELEQRAYSFLGREAVLCMDMVEALRRGLGSVAAVREDGVRTKFFTEPQVLLLVRHKYIPCRDHPFMGPTVHILRHRQQHLGRGLVCPQLYKLFLERCLI